MCIRDSFSLDLAIRKGFQLTSRLRADLRVESFNVTNAPNFGNPNTQVGNVNFGRISGAGSARHSQVAVRLNF